MEKVVHFVSFKIAENGRIGQDQKSKIKNQKKFYWLVLSGILLFAAFLRLYRIEDYMTFLGDEGRDVLVVYNILQGNLTLLGPRASVGDFFLGPIYYYFITPFLWLFNYNPVGPAVMVALFGVATVFLVYKVGAEFFNKGVGFIAAFLYSIAPLAIAYSRSSWNPHLMPFFSLLALYVIYKAVNKNKAKLFILCGFILGIAMQLHYLAVFLGMIIAIYLFLSSFSLRLHLREGATLAKTLKDYLFVFLGFLIGWSPFLAFEIRHSFPNIISIFNFIFHSGNTGGNNLFFGTIYNVFYRLFARLVTNFPPPEQVALGTHPNIAIWYYATLTLAIVSVLFFAHKLVESIKNQEQFQRMSVLALWLIIGVGLFGFYKKPIYDYYLGFLFPLPFMLVGLTIASLYRNVHNLIFGRHSGKRFWQDRNDGKLGLIGKILAIIIFLALAWVNLQGVPFRYPANRQLAQVETISRFVIDKRNDKPFNFALMTGGNSDHAYRYFFTLWQKSPVTIENPKKDPERKTVTDQLLVVCETSPCKPLGNSLWEIAGFGRAEIEKEWDVSVVKVFKLKHYHKTSI